MANVVQFRWRAAAAVLAVSMFLVGGCGQAGSTGAADGGTAGPGGPALPAGWRYVAGTPNPPLTAAQPDLPVTVTDGTQSKVTVHNVDKIIVAGDGVASILGSLGLADNIYAAPTTAIAPEARAAPEKYEFSKQTGAEGLLAMDGTLFIGDNPQRHGSVAQQFRAAGTDAVVLDDQLSQPDKIRALASYVGLAESGETLAQEVEGQLAQAHDTAAPTMAGKNVKIVEVTATGAGGQNAVAGLGTPGTEMIEALGGISVGAEAGLRSYSREMSNEGMVAAAPSVILVTVSDLEKWGGADAMWTAFPTLQQTPAGQQNRVIVMPDAQLKYPSAEIGVGAKALADALVNER